MTADGGLFATNGARGGADEALKRYTVGTHRICPPNDTLARVQPLLADMGITRIANVTGLDRIGIPVVMVIRPNARSVAVSQGKGLTLAAAKASGVMEAAELWHAEHITKPLKLASFEEMRREHQIADPERLARVSGQFDVLPRPSRRALPAGSHGIPARQPKVAMPGAVLAGLQDV